MKSIYSNQVATPTSLNQLTDVHITSPTNNQVLTYSAGQWINQTPSFSAPVTSVFGRTGAVTAANNDYSIGQISGASPLASQANVQITLPSNGQHLIYNNGAAKWENTSFTDPVFNSVTTNTINPVSTTVVHNGIVSVTSDLRTPKLSSPTSDMNLNFTAFSNFGGFNTGGAIVPISGGGLQFNVGSLANNLNLFLTRNGPNGNNILYLRMEDPNTTGVNYGFEIDGFYNITSYQKIFQVLASSQITFGQLLANYLSPSPKAYTLNIDSLGVLYASATSNYLTGVVLTSPSSGQVLQYNGTNWVNVTLSTGSVTSVGLSMPSIFSVSGSPVTSSGTLSATLASQSANTVFAAPDGSSGTPTFRALTSTDLPTIPNAKLQNSSITLATGTTGTDVNVSGSPVSLGGTVTLNIPDASATARGLVSTGTQTFNGEKSINGQLNVLSTNRIVQNFSSPVSIGGGYCSHIALNGDFTGLASQGSSPNNLLQINGENQIRFLSQGVFFGTIDGYGLDLGGTSKIVNPISPTASNELVTKGYVDGKAYALSGLTDVTITSPTNGQVLTYNSGTSKWTNQAAGGGGGSVTSVGLSLPGIFSVTGSPVTSSGTLTATLASQSANTVFAAPSGSAGTPSFRALTLADISSVLPTKQIFFNSATNLVNTGYFAPSSGMTFNINNAQTVASRAMTITAITGWVTIASSAGNGWSFTLQKNSVATALSVSLTTGTRFLRATGSISLAVGDVFCVRIAQVANPSVPVGACTLEYS